MDSAFPSITRVRELPAPAHVCRITSIAAGLNHNAAMSVAGEIYVWGSNKHGCLGLGDTMNRVLPTKV